MNKAMMVNKLAVGDVFEYNGKRYVCEDAEMTGGGTGHGPHDVYPDSLHIMGRILDGWRYRPNAPTVKFNFEVEHAINGVVSVRLVGQMKLKRDFKLVWADRTR